MNKIKNLLGVAFIVSQICFGMEKENPIPDLHKCSICKNKVVSNWDENYIQSDKDTWVHETCSNVYQKFFKKINTKVDDFSYLVSNKKNFMEVEKEKFSKELLLMMVAGANLKSKNTVKCGICFDKENSNQFTHWHNPYGEQAHIQCVADIYDAEIDLKKGVDGLVEDIIDTDERVNTMNVILKTIRGKFMHSNLTETGHEFNIGSYECRISLLEYTKKYGVDALKYLLYKKYQCFLSTWNK